MKQKKLGEANPKGASVVRASISFPPDIYGTLEQIAKEKKVSLAWVVRDAAERYITDEAEERLSRAHQTGRRASR